MNNNAFSVEYFKTIFTLWYQNSNGPVVSPYVPHALSWFLLCLKWDVIFLFIVFSVASTMYKQGCIFISLLHAYIVCSARDDIRKPGAYGESVVNAVIQVLQENCLISDQMFLRRVAKIATNDGMNIQQHGGIWKVIRGGSRIYS